MSTEQSEQNKTNRKGAILKLINFSDLVYRYTNTFIQNANPTKKKEQRAQHHIWQQADRE